MAAMIYRITKEDEIKVIEKKRVFNAIRKSKIEEFSPALLGLGDITTKSSQIEAICSVVDLAGFTKFCSQVDPYLSIPMFLESFLDWFYSTLKKESINKKFNSGYSLYTDLPIFTKFLGDGLLIIWDVSGWSETQTNNLVVIMKIIQNSFKKDFYPTVKKKVSMAPSSLRCGIARGHIFTVGDGNDFVGPCINIASRLQKYDSFSFAVSQRGFDCFEKISGKHNLVLIQGKISGIGEEEHMYVLRNEFEELDPDQKSKYDLLE
jgi:class 3 adenylate cyclase